MKLKHSLLYFLLVISKANFAQFENDPVSLKNNKVIAVTSYYANTTESQLKEFLATPSWYKRNISDSLVYDNKGNLILYRMFEFQNPSKYYDTKLEYNSSGLLAKTLEYNGTALKKTDSMAYNKENFLSYQKVYYNANNYLLYEIRIAYSYKKRNLPVEIRTLSPGGQLNTITVKIYDAKDRLMEETYYEGSKEPKHMKEKKKYTYHSLNSKAIKEIRSQKNENGDLSYIHKFDESGSMIERISYNPLKQNEISSKTTYTKANSAIVETNFDYVQEASMPTSSGNENETAPMIRGDKVLMPVQKKVTTLFKNGLKEITKFYSVDPSGKETYERAIKYEYQYGK